MSNTPWFLQPASGPHADFENRARAWQGQLTKPPGSLGMLEDVAIRLSALQRRDQPSAERVFVAIFAGDHGVVAEGVSAFPQVVTAEMIRNFSRGGAAISVLARTLGAGFVVVNMGTVSMLEELSGVVDCRVGPGTTNFCGGPAMTDAELCQALAVGASILNQAGEGIDIFIAGEMGIGNTTSASALTAFLLDLPGAEVVGPGTGVDPEGVAHKAIVIDRALAKHQLRREQPLVALACLGGFEIAGMAGAYIAAAQKGIPVLLDGFISTAAACVAAAINPSIKPWLLVSHQSAEPAHRRLIECLGARPLLSLDMRLGEGSGAAVAVPLLRSACALHNEMATFADAGVSGAM